MATGDAIVYDVVIIGSGPAGLSAAKTLKAETGPVCSFLVIDSGSVVGTRNRDDSYDVVCGVGGAGLFSDGKFSFYPASTHLWELQHTNILTHAYEGVCTLLGNYGLDRSKMPACPVSSLSTDGGTATVTGNKDVAEWRLKSYPSFYMTLDNRYQLINSLYNEIGSDHFRLNTTVDSYTRNNNGTYELELSKSDKSQVKVITRKIIVAGGRFWPLQNKQNSYKFMRLEYGVRIQCKSDNELFTTASQLKDPKYIYTTQKGVEYRTFCCCREGEIVATQCNGLRTYSGRADCKPTTRSNIGFNVRIKDQVLCDKLLDAGLFNTNMFGNISLTSPINKVHIPYGPSMARLLIREGLDHLLDKFPSLTPDADDNVTATIWGPTIEGVGYYPETDDNLRIPGENIWVCGDACGKFRGIVAALVSGYYAALDCISCGDKK